MLRIAKFKIILLLLAVILPTLGYKANNFELGDGHNGILIKKAGTQQSPRMPSIEASINGHSLTVTFTENLGTVQVEITTATGGTVDYGHIWTPDSYIAYITNTGSYVVTITLGNGDEYYGEFDVTD